MLLNILASVYVSDDEVAGCNLYKAEMMMVQTCQQIIGISLCYCQDPPPLLKRLPDSPAWTHITPDSPWTCITQIVHRFT